MRAFSNLLNLARIFKSKNVGSEKPGATLYLKSSDELDKNVAPDNTPKLKTRGNDGNSKSGHSKSQEKKNKNKVAKESRKINTFKKKKEKMKRKPTNAKVLACYSR